MNQEVIKGLGYLSHEIRGAITGIEAMAELLYSEEENQDKKIKLNYLLNSIDSIKNLSEQLLQSSLYEQGRFSFSKSSFSLNDLLNEINEFFILKFKKKNISFVWEKDIFTKELIIESDKHKIKQILINLIDNAYKYTKSGEVKIKSSIKICKNNICEMNFEVSDTGLGFRLEDHSSVFQEFSRFKTEGQETKGHGLGLLLVKSMVGSLGGEISLESVDGKGSTFSFFVLGRITQNIELQKHEKIELLPEFLIVDDDEISRVVLRTQLESFGAKVVEVENCQEAIELLLARDFTGIIADQNLPDGEGRKLLRKVKEYQSKNIYMALHTAEFNIEKEEGYEVFSKPIKRQQIEKIMAQFRSN